MSGAGPLWLKESILKELIIVVDNPQSNTNFKYAMKSVLSSSCVHTAAIITTGHQKYNFICNTEKYHICVDISLCDLLNS